MHDALHEYIANGTCIKVMHLSRPGKGKRSAT